MAVPTRRFIIVVRADLVAAGNLAAFQADTDPTGGDRTFVGGLSATGVAPIQAYWCSWGLTAGQAVAIRTRLVERGATGAEVAPVPLGGNPSSNRFAVFDVDDGWTPEAVEAKLGLQRIRPLA